MNYVMGGFEHPDVEQVETLLRPMMPDRFLVDYIPDMPRRDGKPSQWFQVVFAVGPGDVAALRKQVHELFSRTLSAISQAHLPTAADVVSLRARRIFPDSKLDPVMFIEAEWARSGFLAMRKSGDFSGWSRECLSYCNHFDNADMFTKQYAGQVSRFNLH
jgi:hypothetical protein